MNDITPEDLAKLKEQLQAAQARADAERARADAEEARAVAERARADAEEARAVAEKDRADAAEAVNAKLTCTEFELLNSALPQLVTPSQSSCKSTTSHSRPVELVAVVKWEHVDPGNVPDDRRDPLDEAKKMQGRADNSERRYAKQPAVCTPEANSESEIGARLLTNALVYFEGLYDGKQCVWQQVRTNRYNVPLQAEPGVQAEVEPPGRQQQAAEEETVIKEQARQAQGQTPAPTQQQQQQARPSQQPGQPAEPSSNEPVAVHDFISRVKHYEYHDVVLVVAEIHTALDARVLLVGELKRVSLLMDTTGQPRDLITGWSRKDRNIRSILKQIATYLHHSNLAFGFISCYLATWIVRYDRVARTLYVAEPVLSTARGPDRATTMGVLKWLQEQALDMASKAEVAAEGLPGQLEQAEEEDEEGGGGKRGQGAREERRIGQQKRRRPADAVTSGIAGGTPQPSGTETRSKKSGQQHPPDSPIMTLGCKLCQGSVGEIWTGHFKGEEIIVKLYRPDGEGFESYERELTAYQAASELQGRLLPRLLCHGQLPSGVPLLGFSKLSGVRLDHLDSYPPEVIAAACKALKALHKGVPGLLHGDVELRNMMLVDQRKPEVMLLDLGMSELNCSVHRQEQEEQQLQAELQCRAASP